MKVIVAGGRDFTSTEIHKSWLVSQIKRLEATEIVCGMAKGADKFGYDTGKELGLKIKEFPADWDTHGKRAGYLRNFEMGKYADACILFPGGKGTSHMKDIANRLGLIVIEWKVRERI